MMVNGQPLSVGFWDTAGNEEYDRLRPLSYPMTDVFGLMFALGGEGAGASLENIQSKWLPEAKHRAPSSAPAMPKSRLEHLCPSSLTPSPSDCPDATMIMIGLKSDTQNDEILASGTCPRSLIRSILVPTPRSQGHGQGAEYFARHLLQQALREHEGRGRGRH